MNIETCRAEFEKWYSNDTGNCQSIIRSGDGYKLMQAQISWVAWMTAWRIHENIEKEIKKTNTPAQKRESEE